MFDMLEGRKGRPAVYPSSSLTHALRSGKSPWRQPKYRVQMVIVEDGSTPVALIFLGSLELARRLRKIHGNLGVMFTQRARQV